MKGYRFKLEALKRYRHFQEEICQKAFSEAQRRLEHETQALVKLIASRTKTESEMKMEGTQKSTGPLLMVYTQFLERLARQIAAQEQTITKAHHKCEEKRQDLIQAMQKRKTLETLKEHGFKTYLQHLNQEEEKFINEMAINRHILNSK